MECVYSTRISSKYSSNPTSIGELINIQEREESQHLRALRLRVGEKIMLTNAEGANCITVVEGFDKNIFTLRVIEIFENYGENKLKIGLALGILDDRSRFEFAIEKSVEAGVTDIFPIICDYSGKKIFSMERMYSKAMAALLQSKRSILPKIHETTNLNKIENLISEFEYKILADESGNSELVIPSEISSVLVFIGPEGGFSKSENEFLINKLNCHLWRMSSRRLRSETAACLAIGMIEYLYSNLYIPK